MPKVRSIFFVAMIAGAGFTGVMIPRQDWAAPKLQETTSQKASDAQKKLSEIMSERNLNARASRLEQFIGENPDRSVISKAYSSLLILGTGLEPDKAIALADEALAKFPDPMATVRETAYVAKINALRTRKNETAITELGLKVLEIETNPHLLYTMAQHGMRNSLKLLEKAMAERAKKSGSVAGQPSMTELRWQYALGVAGAGRMDEAIRLSSQVLEAYEKEIANLETLAADDRKRTSLPAAHMFISQKYWALSDVFGKAGQFDKALEFLRLSESHLGGNRMELHAWVELLRAGLYAKMKRPDLELESCMRSFAVRMDGGVRDRILELAAKTGKKPEEVFERARRIRNESAVPFSSFTLKTTEGATATLSSIKSKATLVNFFFPG